MLEACICAASYDFPLGKATPHKGQGCRSVTTDQKIPHTGAAVYFPADPSHPPAHSLAFGPRPCSLSALASPLPRPRDTTNPRQRLLQMHQSKVETKENKQNNKIQVFLPRAVLAHFSSGQPDMGALFPFPRA